MRYPGFVGGTDYSLSPIAACERTVNFYVEPLARGGKNGAALYPSPGAAMFSPQSSGPAPARGLFAQNGRVFAVSGSQFLEVLPGGERKIHGIVMLNDKPATISANGDGGGQVYVTSGDHGYCFDLDTSAFTTVRTSGAYMGDMLDGYFFSLDLATSTVWASELYDGKTWPLDAFAMRSKAPDKWRAIKALGGELWLFGEHTSEVWYNSGGVPFPLTPTTSGVVDYGIAADFSACRVGPGIGWLSQTRAGGAHVVMATGLQPKVVSNSAVHAAIASYARIDDAIGMSYEEAGHLFYLLYFPSAGITWAYDVMTQMWAERGTWSEVDDDFVAWRPLYHCYAFGRLLAADRLTGDIWHISHELPYDVDGRPMRRLRRAPAIAVESRQTRYGRFELHLESGLGAKTTASRDSLGERPLAELHYSNDGGKTWKSAGTRTAGRQGEYLTRVVWRRLGGAIDRVFQVVVSDPVPWRLIDAYLEAD